MVENNKKTCYTEELEEVKQQMKFEKQQNKEKRELLYLKSSLSEKTWFRFCILFTYSFTMGIVLRYYDSIDFTVFVTMINIGLIIYFIKGISKTKIGKIIQISYGVLVFSMNIILFFAFLYSVKK